MKVVYIKKYHHLLPGSAVNLYHGMFISLFILCIHIMYSKTHLKYGQRPTHSECGNQRYLQDSLYYGDSLAGAGRSVQQEWRGARRACHNVFDGQTLLRILLYQRVVIPTIQYKQLKRRRVKRKEGTGVAAHS